MISSFRIFYHSVGLKSLKHLIMFKSTIFLFLSNIIILFWSFWSSSMLFGSIFPTFQTFNIFERLFYNWSFKRMTPFWLIVHVFKNIFISENCKNWFKLRRCWKQIINQYWSDVTNSVYTHVCLLSDLKLKFNNIDYWVFKIYHQGNV